MENEVKRSKSKRKQNIISAIILIVGTFLAFAIFSPKDQVEIKEKKAPATVKTVEISSENSEIMELEKTITLESQNGSIDAVAEFSGRIRNINFEVGDEVTAGQVLAVFDQSDLQNSPKVSLESAQKSFKIAQDNLDKTEDLVEESIDLAKRAEDIAELQLEEAEDSGTSSEEDLARQNLKIAKDQKEQAEISADIQKNSAELQLEQSRNSLNQAEIAYNKTIIKAPISGKIIAKNVEANSYINAGKAVAEIIGSGRVEAKLFLNTDEIERIKLNDEAKIVIGSEIYPALIDSYSDIANGDNGRFEVKIISKESISQKSNQTAKVILKLYLNSSNEESFFVPLEAVNIGQTKKEVFVAENQKAVAKNVELGKIIGTQVEILSGLNKGDILIVENNRNLQDGQEIKIEN